MLRSSVVMLAAAAAVVVVVIFPTPSLAWYPSTSDWKMRGVNLGSHFILEKWMAYTEYKTMGCTSATDEWTCVEALGQDAANTAFQSHWDRWITQDDITEIASLGLNTIRVPLGFWIYEDLVADDEYFPRGGLDYLDSLMEWCSEAGLYVILGLHAAPGAQAIDKAFTGHMVSDPAFFTSDNYARAYEFLAWLTNRIHSTDAYSGTVGTIEVLNEPVTTTESSSDAASMVETYYPSALATIRVVEANLSVDSSAELHVAFMSESWGSGNPSEYLNDTDNTSFDYHRYIEYDTSVTQTRDGYLEAACDNSLGDVVVGEWSIAVASAVADTSDFSIVDASNGTLEWYQQYWAAQASAFEDGVGWVFWSWKADKINQVDDWRWSYQSAVSAGVIPSTASDAASIAKAACSSVSSRRRRRHRRGSSNDDGVKYIALYREW